MDTYSFCRHQNINKSVLYRGRYSKYREVEMIMGENQLLYAVTYMFLLKYSVIIISACKPVHQVKPETCLSQEGRHG